MSSRGTNYSKQVRGGEKVCHLKGLGHSDQYKILTPKRLYYKVWFFI